MPYRLGRRGAIAAALVLSVLFVGRMAHITDVWAGSRQDVADVRSVLAPVTAGSRVLTVYMHEFRMPESWRDALIDLAESRDATPGFPYAIASWWHYAAFALIDHRAYWSDAFTLPGQQPLITLPPYNASGDGGAKSPYDATTLGPYADALTAPDPASYLAGWPEKIDYVLLLNAAASSDLATLLPRYLVLLDHQGFAALYKVKR